MGVGPSCHIRTGLPALAPFNFRQVLAVAFGAGAFLALTFILAPTAAAFTAWLVVATLLIAASDARRFIVPDVLSLPSIPIGIAANIVLLHGDWISGLQESLWGILLGGGAFQLLRWGYFRLRGIEGLGLGDVKLAAVAGAWLGAELLAPVCLVAALCALAAAGLLQLSKNDNAYSHKLHIPFGSFIAPTILMFWAFRLWEAGLPAS